MRLRGPKGFQGLSPRVRGNPGRPAGRGPARGAIPASAGEPRAASTGSRVIRGYPRECGGTGNAPLPLTGADGLSPRVRGNRGAGAGPGAHRGAIPASAGEPASGGGLASPAEGYPRECGGTSNRAPTPITTPGLSPRVRGNPRWRRQARPRLRAIPASAGEPATCSLSATRWRGYPRECGGTIGGGG